MATKNWGEVAMTTCGLHLIIGKKKYSGEQKGNVTQRSFEKAFVGSRINISSHQVNPFDIFAQKKFSAIIRGHNARGMMRECG